MYWLLFDYDSFSSLFFDSCPINGIKNEIKNGIKNDSSVYQDEF